MLSIIFLGHSLPARSFFPSTFPVGCGFYTVMFLNTLTSSSSSSPSLPSLLSALTISTQTSQSSMLCFHLRQPTPLYPIPCLMHPTPHLLSSTFSCAGVSLRASLQTPAEPLGDRCQSTAVDPDSPSLSASGGGCCGWGWWRWWSLQGLSAFTIPSSWVCGLTAVRGVW